MNRKKLKKLFEASTPVNPLHLLGKNGAETEWTVRLLTGPVLDMKFLSHHQRFWLEGETLKKGRVVGCNVLGRGRRWGFFDVRKGDSSTTIDYDDERNRLTKRVHCEVRTTDYASLVVGRLYVRLSGRPRFIGYFTLRRRGDRRRTPRSSLNCKQP